MKTLREAAECLGIEGDFSVLGDFYGFSKATMPPDALPTRTTAASLKREIQALDGQYFHVNLIRVGSDQFTDVSVNGQPTEIDAIDYSIYRLRDIYAQVNIGVGRVEHYGILTADANGLDSPTRRVHLRNLAQSWSVDNNGLDVFICHNQNILSRKGGNILGLSDVNGPCGEKDPEDEDDGRLTGATSGLWTSEQMSRTIAHEAGHYLSLRHRQNQPENLMCQSGLSISVRSSVILIDYQGDKLREHCFVQKWA